MRSAIVGVCVPVPTRMPGRGTNHEQPMAAERAGTLSATGAPRETRVVRGGIGVHVGDACLAVALRLKQNLIVLLDHDIAVDGFHVFGITRNGNGLVYRLLASGAAGQPYDSILVRVDMNAAQTG